MPSLPSSVRVLGGLAFACLAAAQPTVKYVATPVTLAPPWKISARAFPSAQVQPLRLNNAGQIAGTANDGQGHVEAFLLSGGVTRPLGLLPGRPAACGTARNRSYGEGLNDKGMVVGRAGFDCMAAGIYEHAFLFTGGPLIDLGSLAGTGGSSAATSIDNGRNVVGYSSYSLRNDCSAKRAFLVSSSARMINLGALPTLYPCSDLSWGVISPSGVIGGYSQVTTRNPDTILYHLFIYEGTAPRDLGLPNPARSAIPTAINDKEELVGGMDSSGGYRAFLWDGVFHEIGTVFGDRSNALAINNNSEVVGVSYASTASSGFYYKAGVLTDLNTVVSKAQIGNGTVTAAYAINDHGQILSQSEGGFYVLSPIVSYPVLTAALTHSGDFTAGQRNVTYTATVSNNAGAGPTIGTVTLTPNFPAGLSIVSLSGTGWNCYTSFCNRFDALAGGSAYPPVTITANVAATATTPLLPEVTASGGNSAPATATDPTNVSPVLVSRSRLRFSAVQGGAFVTSAQEVTVSFSSGAGSAWTASKDQGWITLTNAAATGTARFQVAAVPGALVPGLFTGTVTVLDSASGSVQNITVELNVIAPAAASAPFGSFDTPANNATGVAGNIAVTGWALDDIGVKQVTLWRDPVGPEPTHPNGYVYIADALFIPGARPDVEALYPNLPRAYRAGWGYLMLTNGLPSVSGPQGNGVYKIHAIAVDEEGNQIKLGTKTITVDNLHSTKPFGTLDTPAPGETITGTYLNWGWAMTPQPASIPLNGSTVWVGIDGVNFAHPLYGLKRPDIAASFPGYANSETGVGYYPLDTTKFSNGLHNLGWLIYDSLNRGDGIGSRFIQIQNSAPPVSGDPAPALEAERAYQLRAARLSRPTAPAAGYPAFRSGYDLDAALTPIRQAGDGLLEPIHLDELDRLEIHLPGGQQWTAALRVGDESRELPIGSTFDAEGGIFYWQLGPVFLGEYLLEFRAGDGTILPVPVRVGNRSAPTIKQ